MRTQQSRRGETSDANDHKNNTQNLTNCLCHDYSFSSCENQSKPFANEHRKAHTRRASNCEVFGKRADCTNPYAYSQSFFFGLSKLVTDACLQRRALDHINQRFRILHRVTFWIVVEVKVDGF